MNSKQTISQKPGIEPGNWKYINEPAIAADYDASLLENQIAQFDEKLVVEYLQRLEQTVTQGVVVDFGCGTGRSLALALRRHHIGIGIDLSESMLNLAAKKLSQIGGDYSLIKANLLEHMGLANDSIDLGLCLFSTLGMLRGKSQRAKLLNSIWRGLKPGAMLLVHGHSLWYQAQFPGGKKWLVKNFLQSSFSKGIEFGDRYADNRFVSSLFLHSFTLRGFRKELEHNHFRIVQTYPIHDQDARGRSIGWVIACTKDTGHPNGA